MDHIFEHYKRTGYLHHAHVIAGVHSEIVPILLGAINRHMGIDTQGNPDVAVFEYQNFGIDESRDLSIRQSRTSFRGTKKIFIVSSARGFTHEAQNALLKTFEEPTEGSHFFIILPRLDTILPTLKSRVVFVEAGSIRLQEENSIALAEKFLNSSLEERFAMVKKLAEVKKDETIDREKIRQILDHIERILYTRMAGKPSGEIFREIYQAKTYLTDRGSSPKMLLDHLAIVIR